MQICGLLLCYTVSTAQKITYSEPERDDYKTTEFEIIGRVSGNILVYKADRGDYNISVYDNEMQLKDRVKLDFLPKKLISVDFINYPNHAYMIYQFQRKDVVYSFCGQVNSVGVFETAPVMIDSTRIGIYTKENKVYSLEVSEDKSRIMIYKINQDKEDTHVFYTFLYDSSLNLISNSRLTLPMNSKRQFLNNFHLANNGDLFLTKLERTTNRDYITSGTVVLKKSLVDSFSFQSIDTKNVLVDEVKLKLDNVTRQVLITAFYYQQKRGNVEGLYLMRFNAETGVKLFEKFTAFSSELKQRARGESSAASAFNDYFIRRMVNTTNGGFMLIAEAYYTTSRSQPWNRWNYMYGGYGGFYPYYYSPYSPYYYNPYGWNDGQGTRYHYDNIALLAFDDKGDLQYDNFVHKSQFDDGADLYLSYMLVNVRSELRFLFNELDRRQYVLTENTIGPDGKVNRKPTLRNLDKGFTWMPRYGKQIGDRTALIPCIYRNYICFAKIDF